MRLVHIAGGAPSVPLARIGADAELAWDVQTQLASAGLLDPPGDRLFGPVSQWALSEFLQFWGRAGAPAIDMQVASALLQGDVAFPLVPGEDLAGDIARAMLAAGHWICRHPRALNIVYVEEMGLDGTPSRDARFADARLLLRVGECGKPEIAGAWDGSICPERAAARIEPGQYKAWSVGLHQGSAPHDALVQTRPVSVVGEQAEPAIGLFGIDQHCGEDLAQDGMGRASAGGLVGRSKSGHREFMAMLRGDARYLACKGYRFLSTLLPLQAVLG
jgi:hypothetical protein